MKTRVNLLIISSLIASLAACISPDAEWTIIGAGPAGISAIGALLDNGISPGSIRWIDPEFNAGRLGAYYLNVPGNSKASTFQRFITSCKAFSEVNTTSIKKLFSLKPSFEPRLSSIIEPLRDLTHYLITTKGISIVQTTVKNLHCTHENIWNVYCDNGVTITSDHVVLATGCHPRKFSYPIDHVISLDDVLDQENLSKLIDHNDSIAVVGSAHSAVLVMKLLYEYGVRKIINLYLHPFKYKYDMGNNNSTTKIGLAGIAARWAYTILEKNKPNNIIRVLNTAEEQERWLSCCNKIIYAIGFERNQMEQFSINSLAYDGKTGIIAPGLFGIGIAFPESVKDFDGINNVYAIGLIDFIEFAQRAVPQWISKQHNLTYKHIDKVFVIDSL